MAKGGSRQIPSLTLSFLSCVHPFHFIPRLSFRHPSFHHFPSVPIPQIELGFQRETFVDLQHGRST